MGGDEYDMKKNIKEIHKNLSESSPIEKLVIISHVPPFNTVDLCNDGRYVGVKEFRDLITELKPILVACGHIHENSQKEARLGSTLIYNVGRQGVLFTIKNKIVSTVALKS